MRFSAACLILLLFLSFVSVVGVKRSNAYEIVYHDLFKSIHQAQRCAGVQPCECGEYNYECQSNSTRTHTFTLNDLCVYLVVYLKTERVDVSSPLTLGVSAEWRDPTGKLILRTPDLKKEYPGISEVVRRAFVRGDFYVGPPFVTNANWMYYDQLVIRAAPAYGQSRPPGLYTVTVFERGKGSIFPEYFGIGHYPVFLHVEGLPQGEHVAYGVDGVEKGTLEAGRASVISFPIGESHTISTPSLVLASNEEQFECRDCVRMVSEEATVSFQYAQAQIAATTVTTLTTSATSQITTALTSAAIPATTVTVTTKESGGTIDFALLSMAISIVAIFVVAILAVVVLRKRGKGKS